MNKMMQMRKCIIKGRKEYLPPTAAHVNSTNIAVQKSVIME